MKKLVQGIAFILFSILLVFAAALDPFLSTFWGGGLQIVLDLLALIRAWRVCCARCCREMWSWW